MFNLQGLKPEIVTETELRLPMGGPGQEEPNNFLRILSGGAMGIWAPWAACRDSGRGSLRGPSLPLAELACHPSVLQLELESFHFLQAV